ncbi:MAG TPA: hypothetical protein VFB34_07520 [Chloroflexota bacterium]|nr:hypothetical protein [Chloroflexota bacterium]
MEQTTAAVKPAGQLIYLSRNSKLASLFQDAPARNPVPARRSRIEAPRATVSRAGAIACPKLQATTKPGMELTRPLVAALMREQEGMRCRARGVLLDNEYVRDVCSAGCFQHCPFLQE